MYPSDYLTDTEELSIEAHGLYNLILMRLWKNDGNLVLNPKQIAFKCRLNTRTFNRIWKEIEHFFVIKNDVITHKRVDAELAKAIDRSNKARDSVNKRYSTNEGTNVVQTKEEGKQNVPTKKLLPQSQSQSYKKHKAFFEEFYSLYPKKRTKQETLDLVTKSLKPDADLQARIITSLKAQIVNYDNAKSNGQFIPEFPDPVRWLKRKRWEDENTTPDKPLTPFQVATDLAKEKNLEPFKGAPYETKEKFIERINNAI